MKTNRNYLLACMIALVISLISCETTPTSEGPL